MNDHSHILSYDNANDIVTFDGFKFSGELMRQYTSTPCGIMFRVIERGDGVITISQEYDRRATCAPKMMEALRAALAYDAAIQRCSNDPELMASFCTSQGKTLDSLYEDWITKSRDALAAVGDQSCDPPSTADA